MVDPREEAAMRIPVIRLIDLGFDQDFGKSMSFAQSLLTSMNVAATWTDDRESPRPLTDIEYMRSSDWALVAHALTVPARLVHIMGHGGVCVHGAPGFGGADETGEHGLWMDLDELSGYLQERGEGIEATAVFADACGSAQGKFLRALRDSLEREIVYIGATRKVDWRECTTFDSILYGSMLRARGRGVDAVDWMYDAAERSIRGYEEAAAGACPFKVVVLDPSRSAENAFAEAWEGEGIR
jgi:hypothetical protein